MSDTGPIKLPGIPVYKTSDTALASTLRALTEHAEVRAGVRGNPAEAAVTRRELEELRQQLAALTASPKRQNASDLRIDLGGGMYGVLPVDMLVDGILSNSKFKASMGTDDAARSITRDTAFDPNRVESALRAAIEEVQAKVSSAGTLAGEALYKNTGPRHPGAVAIKSDVVLYNDITIQEVMLDLFRRLYSAETPIKVSLDPQSMFYNGFTVEQWAQYIWGKIGS